MLSFTRNQHQTSYELASPDFQPLVISNKGAAQSSFPQQPQKKITKTNTLSKSRDRKNQISRQTTQREKNITATRVEDREGWQSNGKIQIFDRNIRKNQLAEQERQIRAQMKKQKNEAVREIIKAQKNIRGKTLKLEQDQQRQIEDLRRLIEKQQVQKQRNEQQYEKQLKQLQKERNDLIKLQRKIQEHGVRHQKQYSRQIKVLHKNQYPTNDRAKCHQEIRSPKKAGPQFEVSESEGNQQRQALRQQQLQMLTQQRERCMQNQVTMNYNPTIVPLLSRASYKIISTHVSTLVELLVDDILEEQVYHLEEIELKQKLQQQQQRQKNMLQDYYTALDQFVDQTEEIESKLGRYHTMKFQDIYLPKHYPKYEVKQYKTDFGNTYELTCLEEDVRQNIDERKDRFVRFLSNFDEYKRGHLSMFSAVTEELIDEAIEKMARQLDKGSNDFVDVIFRKEFQ